MTIPEIPAATLKAAMDAAWPGLPAGMTLEEAERRTRAAIAAAYPHLVDPAADPRLGALVQLTQGMITKYGELAGSLGEHIQDEAVRRELIDHVQNVMAEARKVWADIATHQTT